MKAHRLLLCTLALATTVQAQTTDTVFPDGFEALQVVRIDDLALRDPHLYVSFIGCSDQTATLNSQLLSELNGDADSDGLLDNNPLLLFRPLDTGTGAGLAQAVDGECTAPVAGTSCSAATPPAPFQYAGQELGTCLAPLPGTVNNTYSPAISAPAGPCFVAAAGAAGAGLPLPVPLLDSRLAASRRDNPTSGLRDGLLYGFLPESVADTLIIDVPLIGPRPLSSLLPGGSGACASHDDRDTHEGASGWWMYFSFAASTVPFSE